MAEWFCVIDGKQVGPIEPAKLKQLADDGTLNPHHKIRREDMAQWTEASQVKGLFANAVPQPAAVLVTANTTANDVAAHQRSSVSQPATDSGADPEPAGIAPATKITLAICGTIFLPILAFFVWFMATHDPWETNNAATVTAELDKADHLQQSDATAAYKIYGDVLTEAKRHKLKDEQFIARLADAEKSRTAVYPIVQEKERAAEAERKRQAAEQAQREAAEKERLALEARKKRAAEMEAESTKPRNIGDVKVRLTEVKATDVRLKDMFGKRGVSKDVRLVVSVELENLSDTKIVRFPGWGYDEIGLALSDSHPVKVSLVDDVGNKYQRLESGLTMKYEDEQSGGDMRPHEKTMTTLIFEQPTDKVEYLELELPARWHNNESMKWTIPKSKIATGHAEAPRTIEDEVAAASTTWVTASDLYREYRSNEVAADEKYKGKILTVTGTVENVGKDIADTPYVAIKAGDVIGSVQRMFSEQYSSDLASLHKGDEVKIRGKCDGKFGNVILRGCIKYP